MDDGRANINRFKQFSREEGWEPTNDHVMVGVNCSIAPTYEEAKQILERGQEYFFGVLGGGIRTAQQLVVQKTRYYGTPEESAKLRSKFVNMRSGMKNRSFDERVEMGLMICGTPDMAVEQITRLHKELGMGRLGLTIKVGNIDDAHVTRTQDYLRDIVFPAVRHLGEGGSSAQAAE
jgi:alkanesulfonate monooxygenase SsuD/methylene tetrahydromethanopterin reductase-like flavin-dependent oxidoreductase (luciferase family)